MSDFINTVDVIGDEAVAASIIDRTITEFADNTIQTTQGYIFSYCSNLESVNLPMCENIGGDTFSNCTNLKNVSLPRIKSVPYQAFSGCTNLETIKFPSATSTGASAFSACYKLKQIDFSSKIHFVDAFRTCYSLISVILRSESVCSVQASNIFRECSHITGTVHATYNPDGLKDGYIYVPKALVEEYKVATNWTTYADRFRALEDYTVDGTITGELDETKI